MGIVRLGDFLKKKFGEVVRGRSAFDYRHRVMAVDASSTIYSFLAKTINYSHNRVNSPTDAHGNQTGHLIGLLYRVLLCKEAQLDTIWVFDGRAPQHKLDELYRRRQLKEDALAKTEAAKEAGDIEEAVRQSKRSIYISSV
jgi:5'-3' exonuclease